jgi:hypothetical protein
MQTIHGKLNPNGIPSFSPGLRGTRYPGFGAKMETTLKGLPPFVSAGDTTPLGLKNVWVGYPG